MTYLGKVVQPLSPMDIEVVEIIEQGSMRYGAFHFHLIQLLVVANENDIEQLRIPYPEVVASFRRWKSGESSYLYNVLESAKTHRIRIVK